VKKTLLILATVAALVGAAWLADRLLPAADTGQPNVTLKASLANAPMAPDVTFKDLQGKQVRLSEFRGKVVLVNFWATWCEPCKIEIPWLIEFQQKYASRGFTILGLSMDEGGAEDVGPFLKTHKFDVNGQQLLMNYPIFLGNDGAVDNFGGTIGYPFSVLVSRDGKIVRKVLGIIPDADKFAKEIEGLL
jgi:cytochrome c biogenesis protein CcmG/thiol:disulfide interchange protein DsbE